MSVGLTTDQTRMTGRSYSDEEWERVKEHFRFYYMEKNMALRDAAKKMRENHGFDATLRQWERRIAPEKWGFQKYANRDGRLKSIQESGKSLLEVSYRGRRKSTSLDGRPSLHEDRNLRRFARREVNREARHRAKSVNALSDDGFSDADMSGTSAGNSPMISALDASPTNGSQQQSLPEYWMLQSSAHEVSHLPSFNPIDQGSQNAIPQIILSEPDFSMSAPAFSIDGQIVNCFPFQAPTEQLTFENLQVSEDFNPLSDENGIPLHSTSWNAPFAQAGVEDAFPTFSFSQNASEIQRMHIDAEHLPPEAPHVLVSREGKFEEAVQIPVMPVEVIAAYDDSVHVDVHVLLHEHYQKTLDMVNACLSVCERTQDPNLMLQSVNMLKTSIQAGNVESDRMIRSTLKNIAITQRRATQNIRDLSTQRKRKVEQLQAQIEVLAATMSTATLEDEYPFS